MEKENEDLMTRANVGSDEVNQLKEENESVKELNAKLEKELLKIKREVCIQKFVTL